VVDGAPEPPAPSDEDVLLAVRAEQSGGATVRDASAVVAARLGVSRRRVYELATRR
jgi:hypothetical protein